MTESRRYRRVGVGERAARSRANSMSNCFLPRDCVAASRSHATGRRAAGKRRDRTRGQADNYDISEELSPVIKMWRAEIESEIFVYVGSMAGAVNRLRCYPGIVCRGYQACFFVRAPCALRQAHDVLLMDVPGFLSFTMREYWVQFLVVEGSLDLFYETI